MLLSSAIKSIKRILTGNMSIKLLCLGVALCIWGVSHIRTESRCELLLPVEIRQIPPGFSAVVTPQGQLHIALSGPERMLEDLRKNKPVLMLSLKDAAAPGKTVFNHLDKHLDLPEKVRAIRISPATIQIELVKRQ